MEFLDPYRIQIIETAILASVIVIVKLLTGKAINRILTRWHFDMQRKRISLKIINIFIGISSILILGGIWNIEQAQFMVFLTSVLTILGIAFFAQWSILSNITSSLILFFNHPLRIGQDIEIMDKEYAIEGRLEDISFFFMHIRNSKGELITIPNNVALQKVILTKKEENTSSDEITFQD